MYLSNLIMLSAHSVILALAVTANSKTFLSFPLSAMQWGRRMNSRQQETLYSSPELFAASITADFLPSSRPAASPSSGSRRMGEGITWQLVGLDR
eukprot:757189-Hanusia_phi.AAC.2